MRALSASDLLEIWERGRGRSPIEQALAILSLSLLHLSAADLGRLTIGQRDACLLHLHELTFGPRLNGLVECPACHDRLELTLEASDLVGQALPLPDLETIEPVNIESSLTVSGYNMTFRLPTSADLIPLAAQTNTSQISQRLLEACLISVGKDDEAAEVSDLPDEALNVLMEKMSQADPLANLVLGVACPACGHSWQVMFDIVSYFWSEIEAWSVRLMREVHILASAYGWREADILAMSAWRRQRYLEMIGT